jgi:hypothetical protein
MKREIHRYPFNAKIGEETKVFLFDQICEQIISITYKNRQY